MKFKFIYILSLSLVIALASFCVFQIIELTEEVYLVQVKQKELNNIFQENEILTNNSANKISLREVESLARDMGFVDARDVSYIEVLGTEVVVYE